MAKNKKSPAKKVAPPPARKKSSPTPVRPAAVKVARPTGPAASSGKATPSGKAAPSGKATKSSPPMEKPSKKNALRDSILKRKVASKPIAFSRRSPVASFGRPLAVTSRSATTIFSNSRRNHGSILLA